MVVADPGKDSIHGTTILIVGLVIVIVILVILSIYLLFRRLRVEKAKIVVRSSEVVHTN